MSSNAEIDQAVGNGAEILTPRAIRFARLSALAAVLLLCFLALASLAIEVFNKLEDLRSVSTDNAEWNFSQVEVDYFRMRSEIERAYYENLDDTAKATQAFDIFYSRVTIVKQGPYMDALMSDKMTSDAFDSITSYLDKWAKVVDLGNATMSTSIGSFLDDTNDIQHRVRRVSVYGLQAIVEVSDQQRRDIANTLLRLAIFTTVTIAVLLISSIFLFRFNQISERSDAETRMINKRLSTVLNASLDAILVMDMDGKIIEYNTAAEVILGYSQTKLLATKW
jgi:PAS domain-containing protein